MNSKGQPEDSGQEHRLRSHCSYSFRQPRQRKNLNVAVIKGAKSFVPFVKAAQVNVPASKLVPAAVANWAGPRVYQYSSSVPRSKR